MLTYYNNQPFLQALSGQTAHVNKLTTKNKAITIALGVAIIACITVLIQVQNLKKERDRLKAQLPRPQ